MYVSYALINISYAHKFQMTAMFFCVRYCQDKILYTKKKKKKLKKENKIRQYKVLCCVLPQNF